MHEPRVHQVVFPGPAWQRGVDFRERPGVADHVAHYRALDDAGKLEVGGPFLTPDGGGMMVATPDVTAHELTTFAATDPAVQSGLLTYEIRPSDVPMRRES